MTYEEIPNAEKAVSDYLRAHASVAGLGARVVGKPPSDTSQAWVQVLQLDAIDRSNGTEHLFVFYLQLDCYAGKAGGQPEATRLGRLVRQALKDAQDQHLDGLWVSRVRFTGHRRLPDTDLQSDPPDTGARERVILDALVAGRS